MAETSLDRLERQYEQAKARLQAAKAREATKQRKLDARRKIILGGALIERAGRDPEAAKLLAALITGLGRLQDRKSFEGRPLPSPPSGQMQTGTETGISSPGRSAGTEKGSGK